jgi:hypothetical protein
LGQAKKKENQTMYHMGQVYFDQPTKHVRLAHYTRALSSLVLSLSQAQARPGNQTYPTCLHDRDVPTCVEVGDAANRSQSSDSREERVAEMKPTYVVDFGEAAARVV